MRSIVCICFLYEPSTLIPLYESPQSEVLPNRGSRPRYDGDKGARTVPVSQRCLSCVLEVTPLAGCGPVKAVWFSATCCICASRPDSSDFINRRCHKHCCLTITAVQIPSDLPALYIDPGTVVVFAFSRRLSG